VIDHERRDGVSNVVSIVGGKLTTYRLMAEQAADLVCAKLGVDRRCTTAEEVLPDQGAHRAYFWLGERLAAHEAAGGGNADLICECEVVSRSLLDDFLDQRLPCSLDDIRRGTRLGMGPCQGAFCTFRAVGLIAERAGATAPPGSEPAGPTSGDPLVAFLRERFRGTRPIAWGRQLQELWLSNGIYWGALGVDALGVDAMAADAVDAVGARAPGPAGDHDGPG